MARAAKTLFCWTLLALVSSAAQTLTFKHVVVIVQENRTPDNLFGSNPNFEPGVDIATSGIDSKGGKVPLTPIPLANCYDLNHVHIAFVKAYDNGKMDGAGTNTVQPSPGCAVPANPQFKFVDNSSGDVQPYFDIAKQYGWANRMFQTNEAASFSAHQFFLAGTSALETNSKLFASGNPAASPAGCIAPPGTTVSVFDPDGDESTTPAVYPCFEHPTLTDVLNAAGISWKYYAPSAGSIWTAPNAIRHMCVAKEKNGVLECTGPDWVNHVVIGSKQVLKDIEECKLATVNWIMPPGNRESDHPKSNDGGGPAWVASLVNALGTHSACAGSGEVYWQDTAIFITWDDWGGWYDHVPPFRLGQPNGWGIGFTYGFRIPLLVVSAYTPAGYVDNANHDIGSILKFIETNFAPPSQPLGPIGPGTYADAYADNSLQAFFTLHSPRPFQRIYVKFNPQLFLSDTARRVFEEMAGCGIGCWF
jgi:phospholipase C